MDFLSNLTKAGDSKPQPAEEKSAVANLVTSAKEAGVSAPAKAAGAAADLLDAASEYAKLDETKGVGKYVEQTETYLREYSTQQSTPAAATEGGGAGDIMKKAQEFFTKPSIGSAAVVGAEKDAESGDGGGLLKAAGGFFSK